MKQKILFSLFFLTSCFHAFPQPGEDSTFLNAAVEHTINTYKKAMGAQAKLYNGSRYQAPQQTLEEHPYFFSEDWVIGDVFYDGEYFQNVPLMYDLSGGVLITEHLSSGQSIQLVGEKLKHFTIADHHFKKIEKDSSALPESGLYDILYDGRTKVIARRQKFLHEEIEVTTILRSYEERNRYFIFTNGIFHLVKSKASVLKVLENKKQLLKKFLKQQGASFSADKELLLKSLAEHYDTIQ